MSINISGISASLITQTLLRTQGSFTEMVESLVSGSNAQIESADQYISQMLNANTQSLYTAITNAQNGMNLTDTADAAIESVSSDISKIRELAVKASNGTYTDAQKQAIQTEIDQLTENINKTLASANYNDKKLINVITSDSDKTVETIKFQLGTGTSSATEVAYDPNIKLSEMNFDVTTTDGAKNAINKADELLSSLTNKRIEIATVQTGLLASVEQNTTAITNYQSSASQIQDTDYASSMLQLVQNQYNQEALLSVLKSNYQSQSNVLSLLSGLS